MTYPIDPPKGFRFTSDARDLFLAADDTVLFGPEDSMNPKHVYSLRHFAMPDQIFFNVQAMWEIGRPLFRLFLLLGLALVGNIACSDDEPIGEIWPQIPLQSPTPYLRVIDIKANAGLLGAAEGHLLDNGRIIFWGTGAEQTQDAISILDPVSGQIETLWQEPVGFLTMFALTPDRKSLWFATREYGKPDKFYVLDLASRRVWPLEAVYGEGLPLLENAVRADTSWKARIEPDGRLLLEWRDWYSIAKWWGKSPADWNMAKDSNTKSTQDVFPRAYLPSPTAWFRQADKGLRLPLSFDVSFRGLLQHSNNRPKPVLNVQGMHYAATHGGIYFSDLRTLPLSEFGLNVQLFNRYRNPQTMQACGSGNTDGKGVWSSPSAAGCARFQGAFVERADDGKLLHILNHGVGVPKGAAVRGRLLALSGISERDKPAHYVSLWDAPAGKLVAHLALPKEAVSYNYPDTLLFSDDARELYGLIDYPSPKLYVWRMEPTWTGLAQLK